MFSLSWEHGQFHPNPIYGNGNSGKCQIHVLLLLLLDVYINISMRLHVCMLDIINCSILNKNIQDKLKRVLPSWF